MRRLSIGGGLLGQMAIGGAALTLIALIWLGSIAALRANRAEVEAHAAAEIANEALIFADQMDNQLAAIDRTMNFLERDWEANPDSFDLPAWRQRALVLSDASLQVFITDAAGIVRQSTDAAQVGKDVADRGFFRNRAGLPSDDGKMFIGGSAPASGAQGRLLNLSRRLDLPDGSFAGVITVTYDMGELNRYLTQAGLGRQGLVELVNETDRMLLAAAGGDGHAGDSIGGSAMWQAMMRTPDGRWIGPSAPDGVARVHAFHQLRERGLDLILAMSERDALRPAMAWEREALIFVSLTTVLVVLVAVALMAQTRAARQRVAALARERVMLAAAKADADAKSQRLEVTLAGMSDGVMMMDSDLRLVEWNDRFPEMTGLPPSLPFRGMSMVHVLRAQVRAGEFGAIDDVEAEVAGRIAAIRAAGDSITTERTRPDGRAMAVRRRRLADGSFVTIYTDITERKRNEDALRQARLLAEATSEAKSRFVAMVSHEIRQPLNALLNSLSLLAGTEIGTAPHRLVSTAQQSGEALLGLLNDILEMSKMEAAQLTLRPDVFALAPLLQGVLDMFADQAAARGMTLTLAIADGTPAQLQADPVRIRQILMNLTSNAVKFAAPGPIVLAAAVEQDMPTMLRLTVQDPGPAIDPAGRARLFQPFVQLGAVTGGAYAGTGLGLAICQSLAALLGGEIGYEPTEAGGNAFWVRLAFDLPAEPKAAPAPRPIFPRTRVLLVEDMRANQLVIATLLRREGHLVDVAASGSAAIRAATCQPYDVVLMDILMPGMTGIEATRHIRALPGPAGQVPICALTGNVSAEDRARCAAAGMNDVLGKPVELDALIAMLGRLVWRHRADWQPDGDLEPPVEQPVLPLLMGDRLAELRAHLAPATLIDLVDQAIEELTSRLAPLHAAVASGDATAIEAEAHAMAGIAGGYAMAALEFRLQAVIEAARAGDTRVAASLCADFGLLLDRSAAALRHAVAAEMA